MKAKVVTITGLAVTMAAARIAHGQEAPPPPPSSDFCEAEESITFDADATQPDLTGVAQLGEVTNWLLTGNGRYVVVAGPDSTSSPLGPIRATSAAAYMTTIGVDPGFVQVTTFAALTPRELHVYAGPDAIVVLSCIGVPPRQRYLFGGGR
jgi:hypothetical protein